MRIHPAAAARRFPLFSALLAICCILWLSGAGQSRAAGASDYAREVVVIVNKERKAAGASVLALDERLMRLAAIRAEELSKNFSHTRPDGRPWSSVLSDHNYAHTLGAENIAWGQSTLNTPQKVMASWMKSSGHCSNILRPNAQKIGVGVFRTTGGKYYWVQLFAK